MKGVKGITNVSEPNREAMEVALEILRYFKKNPQALDGLRGVAEWWVHRNELVVREALLILLSKKIIVEEKERYWLNPALTHLDDEIKSLEEALKDG